MNNKRFLHYCYSPHFLCYSATQNRKLAFSFKAGKGLEGKGVCVAGGGRGGGHFPKYFVQYWFIFHLQYCLIYQRLV